MTNKIQQYIDDIRSAFESERSKRIAESERNLVLSNELKQKDVELNSHVELISNLERDISQLKSEIEQTKTRLENLNSQTNFGNEKNEQIDELVKEIEYCIAQLKQTSA